MLRYKLTHLRCDGLGGASATPTIGPPDACPSSCPNPNPMMKKPDRHPADRRRGCAKYRWTSCKTRLGRKHW